MFYKKVNKNNYIEMFNFLKNHFTYYTMNSWNGSKSIANNVKVYNLKLDGDPYVALDMLQAHNYDEINFEISTFEVTHPGYTVGFNGRNGGYLVLYNRALQNILPDFIEDNLDYESFKKYCKEYYDGMKYIKNDLIYYVELIQDFDKLCDNMRDAMNELSKYDKKEEAIQVIIDNFNYVYDEDLQKLKINDITYNNNIINAEAITLKCLYDALFEMVKSTCRDYGLKFKTESNKFIIED